MPYSIKFTEGFETAFLPKIRSNQDPSLPGYIYGSESGFVQGPVIGRADSGTRLMAKFRSLPPGARVYVSTSRTRAGSAASLVSTGASGEGPGTPVNASGLFTCAEVGTPEASSEIPVINNTATAVWEVSAASTYSPLESYVFGFRVDVPGQTGAFLPLVDAGPAPFRSSIVDQPSATLHIPRFSALTNLMGGVSGRFFPIEPCRLVDTRSSSKPAPFGWPTVAGEMPRTIPVAVGGCSIPAALAYSVNVTAIPKTILGYLSIYPTGGQRPVVSTLNSLDGRVVANAAIVPASSNGSIDIYATNDVDLIIDVNGYFAASPVTSGYDFVPLPPCRIADSRMAGLAQPFGRPTLAASEQRNYPFPLSGCTPPADAVAYVTNITVVPQGFLGYLSVWPSGSERPVVSTLNSFNGLTTANAAIVKAGVSGAVSAYVTNPTELIIDTSGVFAPRAGQGQFYPIAPCRAVDTRLPSSGAPSLVGGTERTFSSIRTVCGVPSTAVAYSLNVTVVPLGPLDYLTVWPAGSPRPVVSTLNSPGGAILANAAIVPAGVGGAIATYASRDTDLIIDVNGYFAQ
jgi:hypothetical protein